MERSRPEHALENYDAAMNDVYAIHPLNDKKLHVIAQIHALRTMALCTLNRTADMEEALRLALPAWDSDGYRKAVDFIARHSTIQAENRQNTACKSP